MSNNKFIVIDGNSLIHRAFHALPILTTAAGEFTNGAYGFTKMLLKIIKDEHPDYLAVAFDKGKITFRNEVYKDYKGTRKATPDELRPQFQVVKDLLQAMDIPIFELEGFEADDLIGTLVKQGEEQGYQNYIVTGDKDALQLISPSTYVKLTRKGISEIEEYDLDYLHKQYELTPSQIIDLKGLMGDSSDNIPGVPGVGEKTGLKLLYQFGTIEDLYAGLDQVKGDKLREKLTLHQEQAFLSKKLAKIACHAPISIADVTKFTQESWDKEALALLFHRLEFRSLLNELPQVQQGQDSQQVDKMDIKWQELTSNNWEDFAKGKEPDARLYLAPGQTEQGLAMAMSWGGGEDIYLWTQLQEDRELMTYLADPTVAKYIHNCKEAYVLLNKHQLTLKKVAGDSMLQAHLLNPVNTGDDMGELSMEYLGRHWQPPEDQLQYLAEKLHLTMELVPLLEEKLAQVEMTSLYQEVELPLALVLAKMELEGITLDRGELEHMSRELGEAIQKLEQEIFLLAGSEFNINSPKQLGVVLFEELKLPAMKKTKTGYSTNAEVLEGLADKHPMVPKILDYRQLVKLKSTYVDGLQKLMGKEDNRVHTTFNQTITATGRLSSTEPNLQNIPIRLEQGRKIRRAFIPQVPGRVLLAADYSQIELRVLAHISNDEKLIQAFLDGEDIHTKTACEVFYVSPHEVTPELRRRAKAVNFGIVYGISDFGLSRDLGIQRGEAKRYIESYLANYPGVKTYLEDVVAVAKERGYVTTILNRRRYLPDLNSRNKNIQHFGERTAMNTPIQGSAADIIKVAMLQVDEQMAAAGLDCKMLLQVHDELIFDVLQKDLEQAASLVRKVMEQAIKLAVPLQVDAKWGYNWYEMTPIS